MCELLDWDCDFFDSVVEKRPPLTTKSNYGNETKRKPGRCLSYPLFVIYPELRWGFFSAFPLPARPSNSRASRRKWVTISFIKKNKLWEIRSERKAETASTGEMAASPTRPRISTHLGRRPASRDPPRLGTASGRRAWRETERRVKASAILWMFPVGRGGGGWVARVSYSSRCFFLFVFSSFCL